MWLRGALLAAVAALILPGGAAAASYSATGEGIEVEMRVRYRRIVFAGVVTTLYCTPRLGFGPVGEPHSEPFLFYVRGHPDDYSYRQSEPVPVGRHGGFIDRHVSSPLDETGSDELLFRGRVTPESVRGSFRFDARYDEDCRTGGFLRYGERDFEMETLRFRAVAR